MPLRVLHVTPSFYPALEFGGPVAALYELCLAQLRAGHKVRVVTSTAGTTGTEGQQLSSGRWIEDFGVPTYYAPVRLPPDLAPAMVPELFRQCRWAQVVHVTGLFSVASVLAMATAQGVEQLGWRPGRPSAAERRLPVVLAPRGALLPWALGQSASKVRKERFLAAMAPLLRRVSGWHVTSLEEADAVRALLHKLGVRSPAVIAVVAQGLSGEAERAEARPGQQAGLQAAGRAEASESPSCQLVALGRIHPVKNLELALEALAVLRRGAAPAATLVIAGPTADPAYAAGLRARAEALGLGGAVTWPGLVRGAAKQRLLADSAMLWLCSHMESFGNVVVEALAAGTPVIATTTTPWELLEQAAVGRWVPPSPQALAAATVDLLARQHERAPRQELAARCQALARTRFSPELSEQQLRQLYLSTLKLRVPPAPP